MPCARASSSKARRARRRADEACNAHQNEGETRRDLQTIGDRVGGGLPHGQEARLALLHDNQSLADRIHRPQSLVASEDIDRLVALTGLDVIDGPAQLPQLRCENSADSPIPPADRDCRERACRDRPAAARQAERPIIWNKINVAPRQQITALPRLDAEDEAIEHKTSAGGRIANVPRQRSAIAWLSPARLSYRQSWPLPRMSRQGTRRGDVPDGSFQGRCFTSLQSLTEFLRL